MESVSCDKPLCKVASGGPPPALSLQRSTRLDVARLSVRAAPRSPQPCQADLVPGE
eukprot:CAMPEP_0115165882 /NCGR_PEP_ID=MMETSP0227-20121206/73831_1 /TAXON_ID=89957 /ORGANISM="Polarella glacialis, Strain CCMP 1383" /LENGTH=55 /DNA_ID=CAMNT_0002578387 /DNA_START=577 /DNA_END=741 /DNA_ORIENTATION=+